MYKKIKGRERTSLFTYDIDNDIRLKLPELMDAERIFTLTDRSRETLREWLGWVDHTKTIEDSKNFIRICRSGFLANNSITTFIVYNDKIVGTVGFNELDWLNEIGHIGYWLDSDYEGKGIMTRAVKGLTHYGFNELQLNRIEIRAATENKKSRSIPERLGFMKEGTIRQGEKIQDRYVDHVIYGMLKNDWKQK